MPKTCDAIVVLGYRLNDDGTADPEMLGRAEKAAEVWKAGVAARIITCGGPTGKSGRTEAEVLKEELVSFGVDEKCVVLEDKSMITTENIVNAQKILGEGKKTIALVTSDYHIFRSALLAKRVGYKVKKYPAPTPKGPVKNDKRKLEWMFTVNMLLGWEGRDAKRPKWADKWMRKFATPIFERLKAASQKQQTT